MRLTHRRQTYRALPDPASPQKETGIGDVRQVTREIVRRADEDIIKGIRPHCLFLQINLQLASG